MLKQNYCWAAAFLRPFDYVFGVIRPRLRIVLVDNEVNRDIIRPVVVVYRGDSYIAYLAGKIRQGIGEIF
jgi:hypothetical protein